MSRFTRFSRGKIWFVGIGPCKRFDIFQLWEKIRAGEGVPRESVRECQVPLNTRHKHLRHTAKNTTREFKTHWKHCNVPTSTHWPCEKSTRQWLVLEIHCTRFQERERKRTRGFSSGLTSRQNKKYCSWNFAKSYWEILVIWLIVHWISQLKKHSAGCTF